MCTAFHMTVIVSNINAYQHSLDQINQKNKWKMGIVRSIGKCISGYKYFQNGLLLILTIILIFISYINPFYALVAGL